MACRDTEDDADGGGNRPASEAARPRPKTLRTAASIAAGSNTEALPLLLLLPILLLLAFRADVRAVWKASDCAGDSSTLMPKATSTDTAPMARGVLVGVTDAATERVADGPRVPGDLDGSSGAAGDTDAESTPDATGIRLAVPLTILGATDGLAGVVGLTDALFEGETPGGSGDGVTLLVALLDGDTPGGNGDGVAEGANTAVPPPRVLAPAAPAAAAALASVAAPQTGRAESPAAGVRDALTCRVVAAKLTGHG